MAAHTVISHALTQGISLDKATDLPALPQALVLPGGPCRGYKTVAPVRVSLVKGVTCGWCEDRATRVATAQGAGEGLGGWSDYMCLHHALVWGRFVDAYAIRPVPGRGVAAWTLDWGFTEAV